MHDRLRNLKAPFSSTEPFTVKIKYKLFPYFTGKRLYRANFQVKQSVLDPDYWIIGMENTVKRNTKLRLDVLHTYEPTIHACGLAAYGLGLHILKRDNDQDTIVQFILAHLQNAVDAATGIEYSYWREAAPWQQGYYASGIGQGSLLSFLCRFNLKRAWPGLDEVIERIANSFLIPFESKNGFVRWLDRDSAIIEEYPINPSMSQVLNGWCRAIFGLFDYLNYRKAVLGNGTRLDEKQRLLESTLSTLRRVLPNYDTGFWSLYNLPNAEEKIANIASIDYHNEHITWLEAMWHMTGDDIFKVYADRFRYYSSRLFMRLRALFVKIVFTNVLKYGYLYRR